MCFDSVVFPPLLCVPARGLGMRMWRQIRRDRNLTTLCSLILNFSRLSIPCTDKISRNRAMCCCQDQLGLCFKVFSVVPRTQRLIHVVYFLLPFTPGERRSVFEDVQSALVTCKKNENTLSGERWRLELCHHTVQTVTVITDDTTFYARKKCM